MASILLPHTELSCWRHPFHQFLLSTFYCNIDTWLMDIVFNWCWASPGECFQRIEITDFVWMARWGSKAGGGFQAYAGHTSVIEEGGRWRMSIHRRRRRRRGKRRRGRRREGGGGCQFIADTSLYEWEPGSPDPPSEGDSNDYFNPPFPFCIRIKIWMWHFEPSHYQLKDRLI